MCVGGSSPKPAPVVKAEAPAPPAPPPEPIPTAPVLNEAGNANKSANDLTVSRRKGTSALRIDLNVPGADASGSNGLSIPR